MTDAESEIMSIVRDVNPSIEVSDSDVEVSLFDLGFDSLDHATILLQVEETFDVKIPDEESENLITVRQIAGFVAARKAA